mgnify:CR=1 FL=1
MPKKTPKTSATDSTNTSALILIIKEGALISLLAVGIYFLMALVSYSPQDPGPTTTGDPKLIQNSAGAFGAWLADASLSTLGYIAYLIPFALIHRAWSIFRDRYHRSEFDLLLFSLRETKKKFFCLFLYSFCLFIIMVCLCFCFFQKYLLRASVWRLGVTGG